MSEYMSFTRLISVVVVFWSLSCKLLRRQCSVTLHDEWFDGVFFLLLVGGGVIGGVGRALNAVVGRGVSKTYDP